MPTGRNRAAFPLLALSTAVLLGVTLIPGAKHPSIVCHWGIVCGRYGTSDILANILLLIPWGLTLRLATGWDRWRVVLLAVVVTAGIEMAQTGIPGRHPNPGDVLFDSVGAWLGSVIAGAGAVVWARSAKTRRILALTAAGLVAALLTGTAWLVQTAFPRSDYYGQWTPDLGVYEVYGGRILTARLGTIPLPGHRLPSPDAVRKALPRDTLRIRFIAGPAPDGFAPIFSIFDDQQREILMVAAVGHTLFVRRRLRSAALYVATPHARSPVIPSWNPGDTVTLSLAPDGPGFTASGPGLGTRPWRPSAARGWSFVMSPTWLPEGGRRILDFLWLAAWLFPLGWFGSRRGAIAATTMVALSLGATVLAGHLAFHLLDPVAMAVGWAAGHRLWRQFAQWQPVAAPLQGTA